MHLQWGLHVPGAEQSPGAELAAGPGAPGQARGRHSSRAGCGTSRRVSPAICNLGAVRPWDSLRSPTPMGVALLLLVLSCLECTNKSGLLGVPLAPVAPLTSPTHVGLVAVDYVAGPSLKTDHYKGSSEALHPSLPSLWIIQLEGNGSWLPAPSSVQSPCLFPWSAAWERRQSCHKGCPPQPGIGRFLVCCRTC